MKDVLYKVPRNIRTIFSGRNLLFHVVAIIATYFLVISGFDWDYFIFTRSDVLLSMLFPAVIIGGFLPFLAPLFLLVFGKIKKNTKIVKLAFIITQAEILALLTSFFYKALTGRAHPDIFSGNALVDISTVFNFGILEGGVFWGWPSSHTAVAFAFATVIVFLHPKNKILRYTVPVYAMYVGLGVSVTVHWFSDFIAGAILGTLVGMVVGKSFFDDHVLKDSDYKVK